MEFSFNLSSVCWCGSNLLLEDEDVISGPSNEGGSCVDNRLTAMRTKQSRTLHHHTETYTERQGGS